MPEALIRGMAESDLEIVLSWRNHPDVRRYMYTTHEITLTEHRAWFKSVDENPDVDLLIYEEEGLPKGFVNLSRTRSRPVADWGFYVAPGSEKGVGRRLGHSALSFAFSALSLHKVCGQALDFNDRSVRFHLSLGFTQEGRLRDQHYDGKEYRDVVCFGLLENEWEALVSESVL